MGSSGQLTTDRVALSQASRGLFLFFSFIFLLSLIRLGQTHTSLSVPSSITDFFYRIRNRPRRRRRLPLYSPAAVYLSICQSIYLHRCTQVQRRLSPRLAIVSLSLYLSLSLALCCVHGGAAAVQRDVPAVGLVRAGVGRQQELLGGDQAGGGGRRRGRGAGGGAQPLHRARARRVQGHGARAARARPAVAARRRLRLLQALRRRRQGQEQGRRQRQSQGQAAPLTDLVRTTSGSAFGYRRRSIGTEFGSFRMLFQIKATVTISSFDGRFIKIIRKKAQKFRTQRHFDPTRKLE